MAVNLVGNFNFRDLFLHAVQAPLFLCNIHDLKFFNTSLPKSRAEY